MDFNPNGNNRLLKDAMFARFVTCGASMWIPYGNKERSNSTELLQQQSQDSRSRWKTHLFYSSRLRLKRCGWLLFCASKSWMRPIRQSCSVLRKVNRCSFRDPKELAKVCPNPFVFASSRLAILRAVRQHLGLQTNNECLGAESSWSRLTCRSHVIGSVHIFSVDFAMHISVGPSLASKIVDKDRVRKTQHRARLQRAELSKFVHVDNLGANSTWWLSAAESLDE